MTLFGKALASGKIQAPARTSWWPRHTRAMMKYLNRSGAKNPDVKTEISELMRKDAEEWETLIPKAARHGLMVEHSDLEIALVDAVRQNQGAEIDKIGKRLMENASQLSAALGIAVVEFPEEHFRRLFTDHVKLYAGCARKKIEGLEVDNAGIESNMLTLADFTAEWL